MMLLRIHDPQRKGGTNMKMRALFPVLFLGLALFLLTGKVKKKAH